MRSGPAQELRETPIGVERPDFLVMDARLPEMDSRRILQELRGRWSAPPVPAVLLTTISLRTASQQQEATPETTSVSKPPRLVDLAAAIRRVSGEAPPAADSKTRTVPRIDERMSGRMPLRLLLTDDNPINQKVALRLLKQMGYSADVAGNGREAVAAFERKLYDIIFMDVQMPELDGVEATRRIRELEQSRTGVGPVVIVAMTANAMLGDREKCLAAGMNDYLSKPVKPEALQETIQRWGASCTARAAAQSGSPDSLASGGFAAANKADRPAPVDMERLREFSAHDDAAMRELAMLFIEQTGQQIVKLLQAHRQGNIEEVRRIAHSCAGGSVTCGMNVIGGSFRQIEMSATPADFGSVAGPLSRIEEQFEEIRQFLDQRVLGVPH